MRSWCFHFRTPKKFSPKMERKLDCLMDKNVNVYLHMGNSFNSFIYLFIYFLCFPRHVFFAKFFLSFPFLDVAFFLFFFFFFGISWVVGVIVVLFFFFCLTRHDFFLGHDFFFLINWLIAFFFFFWLFVTFLF